MHFTFLRLRGQSVPWLFLLAAWCVVLPVIQKSRQIQQINLEMTTRSKTVEKATAPTTTPTTAPTTTTTAAAANRATSETRNETVASSGGKKYQPLLRLAHVMNPYSVTNQPDDLFYPVDQAQNITFASMIRAWKKTANHSTVKLYAAVVDSDRHVSFQRNTLRHVCCIGRHCRNTHI